jgi:hypothetical protein
VRRLIAAGAALVALGAAGCGSSDNSEKATTTGGSGQAKQFSQPTRIDNPWFPLRPGTRYVSEGSEYQKGKRVDHHVVFIVTDLTKMVGGVRTRVIWDRDFANGTLLEGELAFDAQDDAGNVWSYGEYPEEWEGKKVAGAPATWIPGVQGAKPGILMQAAPRAGAPSYQQGFAPKISFGDRARVKKVLKRLCVPAGCYRNVLQIEEWTPEEPGAKQLKYHAPGTGTIKVGFESGAQREELHLVRVDRLSPAALARVRKQALAIDRRAYTVSRKVYGRTPRAVPGP